MKPYLIKGRNTASLAFKLCLAFLHWNTCDIDISRLYFVAKWEREKSRIFQWKKREAIWTRVMLCLYIYGKPKPIVVFRRPICSQTCRPRILSLPTGDVSCRQEISVAKFWVPRWQWAVGEELSSHQSCLWWLFVFIRTILRDELQLFLPGSSL